MDKIIGMGNALVDVLVTLPNEHLLDELQLPKGSMQLINEERFKDISLRMSKMNICEATGGSAANTMLALAKLGVEPGFIGKIGQDAFGNFFEQNAKKNGIETKLLLGEQATGVASTFILPDGERTFATYLGSAASMKASELSLDLFVGYTYFYIEGYLVQDHELITRAMQLAKEAGAQVCLDLASYNIVEEEREFLITLIAKYVDIVFANEAETDAFSGGKELLQSVEEIASLCSVVVIKLGSKGSFVKKGTEKIKIEIPVVSNVVDTTGAGDFYAAGFLYGLTCGYSLDKCCFIGSILSSYVIQEIGTALSDEVWDEIKLNIEQLLASSTN
ncbi:MAG: adenosine kinase [Phocaeicola sp.]